MNNGIIKLLGASGIYADCPDNWIRYADSCYLFMTRYPMQWIEAMVRWLSLLLIFILVVKRSSKQFVWI